LATALPELPDSFFGWIVPLWKITDEQVLASAGLDAYVVRLLILNVSDTAKKKLQYLAFFKMAIKFLLVTLFFALAVIKPVHDTHQDKEAKKPYLGGEGDKLSAEHLEVRSSWVAPVDYEYYTDYLWMYLVFVYLFTALILYLIVSETRRIIEIRQEYLGSQTTITDRTIRLSGIPINLRSEDKIKEFIEDLEIGRVESVTLCKNWKDLDEKVTQRQTILRKLEEAWTVHLGTRRVERSLETLPVIQPTPPEYHDHDGEADRLLGSADSEPDYAIPSARPRPNTKIWYGRFKLRYRTVDAIDYYEEKLRTLDNDILLLRKRDFEPTPLAFVTMDSVASAQMAIQAVLDPSPLQLLANNSPAPSDVVWPNTYLSRTQRIFRSWTITFFIGILSVFWTILLVPIAGALNICSIHEVFPRLADALNSHDLLKSLVNIQLPTLLLTLINVLVPFLYDCKYSSIFPWQTLTVCRVVEQARHDLTRRRRAVCDIQELFLYLFQLFHPVHDSWNCIRIVEYACEVWREVDECNRNRICVGHLTLRPTRLLHELHYSAGLWLVSLPFVGIWCSFDVSHLSDRSQDASRQVHTFCRGSEY
jgi:hypothetical protein